MSRSSLRDRATTNSLGAILEALLFSVPGVSGIADFQRDSPEFLTVKTRSLVPQIMAKYPDLFPKNGTVRISDNKAYLSISDQSNYTIFAATALNFSEKMLPGLAGDRVQIIKPPSSKGTYIDLPTSASTTKYVGSVHNFTLDWRRGIVAIPASEGNIGNILPLVWYVVYVDGLPRELYDIANPPYIVLALMASLH